MERSELEIKLADSIEETLRSEIETEGKASLLVSGGSTPKGLFNELSKKSLDWSKVFICPVDERFLEDGHADQNGELIKDHLLVNNAHDAILVPLIFDPKDELENLRQARLALNKLDSPFTVVILGMGTDGHTASLFPDAEELAQGMDLSQQERLLTCHPKSAPYSRITFTRSAIFDSKRIILHIYGTEKKQVFDAARSSGDWKTHPIAGFIDQPQIDLEVFR